MTHRFLRAFAALITLLVIAIGVPLVLTRWGHWPLDGLPTWEHIRALPDTIVSDTAVFGLLTISAWTIWALFMCSVVIEVAAELTGNEVPRLPFAGPLQRNARRLVAATLMTVSVLGPLARGGAAQPLAAPAAITSQSPAPAQDPAPPSPEASDPITTEMAPSPVAPNPQIEVRRGDNPWDLANRHLGDPMRWREVWDLNRGAPQPDGRAWVIADLIEPGWVLQLPSDAIDVPSPDVPTRAREYIVQPGDTLSGISEEQLGDQGRAMELFELNQGRPQPDDDSLHDPDLIRPGWHLEIPATDVTDAPVAAVPQSVPPPVPGPPSPSEPLVTTVPGPTPSDLGASVPQGPVEPAPLPHTADNSTPRADEQAEDEGTAAPLGLVGGGVATAGLLLLLERRRRAQQRHRTHGQRVPLPPNDLQEAERELRAGAAVDSANFLDAALRAAAAGAGPALLTDLAWVEAGGEHVELVLATAGDPPEGFAGVDARRWITAAPISDLDQLGALAAFPTPALAPIGTTPTGTEILIDLEAAPVTLVEGDHDRTSELLASMAAGLSSAPWSGHPRLLLVGFTDHLTSLPGVEAMPTLRDALDAAVQRADRAASALRAIGSTNTVGARADGATPDAWEPLIVVSLIAPDVAETSVLNALAERPHNAVSVLCPTPGTGSHGRVLTIDHAGLLRIAGMDTPVRPRGLQTTDIRAVAQLLASATDLDAATSDDALLPSRRPLKPVLDLRDVDAGASEPSALLPMLTGEIDVLVRVLGDVEAVRLNAADEERLTVSKQRALEAITYLALREASVDREDVQAALWPNGANSAKTFSNAIWEARRVLGAARDEGELFPEAAGGRYTLSDRVVTDYGLFCELVAHADQVEDAEHASELLAEALTLVRGEPFTGVGRSYAWVGPHRGMIVAQVVDAAEELAEVRLATGDWRGAEWAARQGLRAMPCDERMYRLLMRSAHASGNIPAVHRAFMELCDAVADPDDGAEPDDTVHPDTVALLEQLTTSRRSPRVSA